MSANSPVAADTLIWHPSSETELMPDVALPYVKNDLVTEATPPDALLIAGFGESAASSVTAVSMLGEHGIPAAATWLTYSALPPSHKNLDRIATEAPRELALYLGGGTPMHMFTNSLGCLGIIAAAEAPELFNGVGAQAPYAFAHESYGRLPVVGATDWTRVAALGLRLGIQTPLQMRHHWRDKDIVDVGRNAIAELRTLGVVPGVALRYALSPSVGRRVINGFVGLSIAGHPTRALVGQNDKLVTESEIRAGLKRAAIDKGIDPDETDTYINSELQVVPGAHSPWCSPVGRDQLSAGASWLSSLQHSGGNGLTALRRQT
jgi:hypothetical protein